MRLEGLCSRGKLSSSLARNRWVRTFCQKMLKPQLVNKVALITLIYFVPSLLSSADIYVFFAFSPSNVQNT